MKTISVGKRDFIQHTSKYLQLAEHGNAITITHRNIPKLQLNLTQKKSIRDLRGMIMSMTVEGNINDPILAGFDQW